MHCRLVFLTFLFVRYVSGQHTLRTRIVISRSSKRPLISEILFNKSDITNCSLNIVLVKRLNITYPNFITNQQITAATKLLKLDPDLVTKLVKSVKTPIFLSEVSMTHRFNISTSVPGITNSRARG